MNPWQILRRAQPFLIGGGAIAGSVLLLRFLGALQPWEVAIYDRLIQARPSEPVDSRIVIVGINEPDLQALGHAQITDAAIAQLIGQIRQHRPRVIGLDLYRNRPQNPGSEQLAQIFRTTPNLIGIEKVVSDATLAAVPGNSILKAQGQIAASDLLLDFDGRVRRGVLFPSVEPAQSVESLAWRLAAEYLIAQGNAPTPNTDVLTFGRRQLPPIESQEGGFHNLDARGYQVLLNLRTGQNRFQMVKAIDVLQGKLPADTWRDRIVLIGDVSPSNGDWFLTSHHRSAHSNLIPMFGVEVHAHFTSQIISSVLDGRPHLRGIPQWAEALMIVGAVYLSFGLYQLRLKLPMRLGLVGLLALAVLGSSYGLLVVGWWLPVVGPWLGIILASGGLLVAETQGLKTLSTKDELTQLANRRLFNQTLDREWRRLTRSRTYLSLILCDIDFFKLYNDTYGHPKGDACLQQVARAIATCVGRPADVASRYGGEEFAILLPETDEDGAIAVAEKIRTMVAQLELPHAKSEVGDYVTLSLGVATVIPEHNSVPETLVNTADLALYQAKHEGRNRVVRK
jgi:adenylate cyclase